MDHAISDLWLADTEPVLSKAPARAMPRIPLYPFRPDRSGTARWLRPSWARIMDLVWDAPRAVTIKYVWRTLDDGRALTTIQTHLLLMTQAGLLLRYQSYGSVFAPACTRQEFEQVQTDALLTALGADALADYLRRHA